MPCLLAEVQVSTDDTIAVRISALTGREITRRIRTADMHAAMADICEAAKSLHTESRNTPEGAAEAVLIGAYCELKMLRAA